MPHMGSDSAPQLSAAARNDMQADMPSQRLTIESNAQPEEPPTHVYPPGYADDYSPPSYIDTVRSIIAEPNGEIPPGMRGHSVHAAEEDGAEERHRIQAYRHCALGRDQPSNGNDENNNVSSALQGFRDVVCSQEAEVTLVEPFRISHQLQRGRRLSQWRSRYRSPSPYPYAVPREEEDSSTDVPDSRVVVRRVAERERRRSPLQRLCVEVIPFILTMCLAIIILWVEYLRSQKESPGHTI